MVYSSAGRVGLPNLPARGRSLKSTIAVLPVAAYTSVELDGWSMSPALIAFCLAMPAIVCVPWAGLIYAPLLRRLGRTTTFIWASAPSPIFFSWHAIANVLLRHEQRLAFFITLPIVLGSGPIIFATVQSQLR